MSDRLEISEHWAIRRRNGGIDANDALLSDPRLLGDEYGEWVPVEMVERADHQREAVDPEATYQCPTCVGTGQMESSDSGDESWWDCSRCKGTGNLADRRRPGTGVVMDTFERWECPIHGVKPAPFMRLDGDRICGDPNCTQMAVNVKYVRQREFGSNERS